MASSKTNTRRTTTRGQDQRSGAGRLQTTIRDTISEIKKVTWPDRETTRNLTIVVIAMAVALGALLGGIDAIFVRVWENVPTF
jgi:preprotein translocase subunit SecE